MIRITHTAFLISSLLFSMSTESTNIGLLMKENKGGFCMTTNVAITPQKPSSNEDIGQARYLNASLLLPNGMNFSFGNSLEENSRYNYLDFSYYIKDKDYTLGVNIRSHYNNGLNYGKKPKELGASFSYKISKQLLTPYLKYTYRQYHLGKNLQLLTVGGFASISQLIFSFSYTLPINADPEFYNGKGEISLNLGVFLD